MPTQTDKDNFLAEMLSPVSKLERARQYARIEQQRRIDQACARKVAEKKNNAAKRKAVATKLDSHVKRKVRNVDHSSSASEPTTKLLTSQRACEPRATSWFHKKKQSTNVENEDLLATPQRLERRSARYMKLAGAGLANSSAEKKRSNSSFEATYVEGDDIMQHLSRPSSSRHRSGKKTTLKTSSSSLERLPGESLTKFAIRSAKFNREQQQVSSFPGEKKNVKIQRLARAVNSYRPHPTPQPMVRVGKHTLYNDEQDDDEQDNKGTVPMESKMLEEKHGQFVDYSYYEPPQESTIRSSPKAVWSCWSVILLSAVFSSVMLGYLVYEFSGVFPKGFCDTLVDDTTTIMNNETAACLACPKYGHCAKGELNWCENPYVLSMNATECIPSQDMNKDVQNMMSQIDFFLHEQADNFYCPTSFPLMPEIKWTVDEFDFMSIPESVLKSFDRLVRWFEALDEKLAKPVLVSFQSIQAYVIAQEGRKQITSEVFIATFGRAMADIVMNAPSILVSDDSILVLDQTFIQCTTCRVGLWMYCHRLAIMSAFVGLYIVLSLLFRYRHQRTNRQMMKRMASMVQNKLINQSQASHAEFRAYPVANLRDFILDQLDVAPGKPREHLLRALWPQIQMQVKKDSRIRQTQCLHRGKSMMHWEWISPDLTHSTDPSSEIQKKLHFD